VSPEGGPNDRFLKQITAPTLPAPLTPDQISQQFQSFYKRAFAMIPTLLPSSGGLGINLHPLLTGTEIAERKRLRAETALRRATWEEEIERRVTAAVYDRIFRPRTGDDEERDMKLHGKMKALVVVGVTLEHLGVELTPVEKKILAPAVDKVGQGIRSKGEC
jgi:hypothetical protein